MSVSSHAFEQFTLAFYNLENLFDYTRNKRILDADFTSEGRKEWTRTRYEKKLERLSRAISQIGYEETGSLPHILGVAEVENKKVLTDLAAQPLLSKAAYEIVHYDILLFKWPQLIGNKREPNSYILSYGTATRKSKCLWCSIHSRPLLPIK